MSEENEALEKRLEKLEPLEQEALAAKILENWQIVKAENASAAQYAVSPIFGNTRSASARSHYFASFSYRSAFAGAIAGTIVGAAATFLGMTLFTPPKVEIREIVREVPVKAESANDARAQPPETEWAVGHRPSLAESGSESQSFEQPKAMRRLEDRLALSEAPFRDLDSLLAQRMALARQMARYKPSGDSASSGFVPPRISPEEYRKLLRELKL